jgi:hypothetical protein
MRKLLYTLTLFTFISCSQDYTVVSTEIVKGVVTAKDEGNIRVGRYPKFYVTSPKQMVTIDVPFDGEDLFHIGDTICVVVKTVKDNTDEHRKD